MIESSFIKKCDTGVKELLDKAQLNYISKNYKNIEECNLIGTTPSAILDGIPIKLLRMINDDSRICTISTPSKRRKLKILYKKRQWIFQFDLTKFHWKIIDKMLEAWGEEDILEFFQYGKRIWKKITNMYWYYHCSCYVYYRSIFGTDYELAARVCCKSEHSFLTIENQAYFIYQYHMRKELMDDAYVLIKESTKKLEFEDEMFTIQSPPDIEAIFYEAINQNNCLAMYVETVLDSSAIILFMRLKENPKCSYITIEIRDNKIVQVACKNNEDPKEGDIWWLSRYAKIKGLELEGEWEDAML